MLMMVCMSCFVVLCYEMMFVIIGGHCWNGCCWSDMEMSTKRRNEKIWCQRFGKLVVPFVREKWDDESPYLCLLHSQHRQDSHRWTGIGLAPSDLLDLQPVFWATVRWRGPLPSYLCPFFRWNCRYWRPPALRVRGRDFNIGKWTPLQTAASEYYTYSIYLCGWKKQDRSLIRVVVECLYVIAAIVPEFLPLSVAVWVLFVGPFASCNLLFMLISGL